ncbi:MAG: hypothetical protein ACUVWZ_02625 [Anaerolineae bacterium]
MSYYTVQPEEVQMGMGMGGEWQLYDGSRVRVVEPAWLGKRVAEEHRKAAEIYG